MSLIVPTYNRADMLENSLLSFIEQNYDPEAYEILVVDNNSTDQTRETVLRMADRAKCGLFYVPERRQGLHYARNTGILQAEGDIVVFGDDDIWAEENWLARLAEEFDHHPRTGIVGGKVLPIWSIEPEDWIYDYGDRYVHPVFAYLDYGDDRLLLDKDYVLGCSLAIRRSVALEIGGSYPDTFPRDMKHLSGTGENAMIDHSRALGHEVVYLPKARVHHYCVESRVTLEYFIERYERWAIEDVFHTFRSMGKDEAASYLIDLALERYHHAQSDSLNKINPAYYRAIHGRGARQMIEQTLRTSSDPSLYKHITKRNYLW